MIDSRSVRYALLVSFLPILAWAQQAALPSSRPSALVLFNPAVDTTSEGLKRRFGDRVTEVSPLHHPGSSLPPTIILHGKSDTIVPYADVERFCTQAKSRGLPCELVGYEGVAHGFFHPEKDEHGKLYRETLLEADRFLTKNGYLQGPSPTQIP